MLRKSTPESSKMNSIASHYKLWYVNYLRRSDCFFSQSFKCWKPGAKRQLLGKVNHKHGLPISSVKFINGRFCLSQKKLLLSDDIETNPGPVQKNNRHNMSTTISNLLWSIDCVYLDLNHRMLVMQVTVFSKLFHTSYMVVQIITWIYELQALNLWGKILNDLLKATQSTLGCNIWQIWLCKAHGLIIQAVADSLCKNLYCWIKWKFYRVNHNKPNKFTTWTPDYIFRSWEWGSLCINCAMHWFRFITPSVQWFVTARSRSKC